MKLKWCNIFHELDVVAACTVLMENPLIEGLFEKQ
jgi:hypothetical protein